MEKSMKIQNQRFILNKEKLCWAQTKEEVSGIQYLYVRNYPDEEYVIIGTKLFQWFSQTNTAKEIPLAFLCKDKIYSYYYSENEGKRHGEGRFVFAINTEKIYLIGRAFAHIHDNLYKIGRYAYQIVDGELEKLCECMEFETIDVRVEISAEENGISEMQAFKKVGNRWKQVTYWRPGNIVPSSTPKSNLKK